MLVLLLVSERDSVPKRRLRLASAVQPRRRCSLAAPPPPGRMAAKSDCGSRRSSWPSQANGHGARRQWGRRTRGTALHLRSPEAILLVLLLASRHWRFGSKRDVCAWRLRCSRRRGGAARRRHRATEAVWLLEVRLRPS